MSAIDVWDKSTNIRKQRDAFAPRLEGCFQTMSPTINQPSPIDVIANKRLAFRFGEFMEVTGVSRATLFKLIKNGEIRIAKLGTLKLIPRDELVRLGLLAA